MRQRHIELQGALNFRDFGGYPTQHGTTVKSGRLFRSARLSDLTAGDIERLQGLEIRNICDLRRPREQAAAPTRWCEQPAAQIRSMPLITDHDQGTVSVVLEDLRAGKPDIDAAAIMRSLYARLATANASLAWFRRLFELVASEQELPILIHCTGGKDRTGVACALIQWVLGVSEEDIYADYLLSQKLFSERFDVNAVLPQIFDTSEIEDTHHAALAPVYSVDSGYLDAALAPLRTKYTSADEFVVSGLGCNPALPQRLRDLLLA